MHLRSWGKLGLVWRALWYIGGPWPDTVKR